MDCGEKGIRQLIVACRDCPESFEFAEEPLDEISLPIESEICFALDKPVRLGWDNRHDPSIFEGLDQFICIISFVGQERAGLELFQQWRCLAEIGLLTGRQRRGDGIAQSVDNQVNFGCQSPSGSTDGLIRAVFFSAPALC